jgi:D-alanyl-D-alanine carboxypeptidase/D-alanyl-D-alanine-endopeptidase (penicillin-binding protein 4)
VIEGDLFIVGGGDPLLATSGYKTVFDDPDQFYEDFTTVADSLNAAGIRSIRGDLVGDDSRYDAVRWVPTWPARYQVGGTVAPLSALLVNDGNTGYTDTPNDATSNRKAGDSPLLFAQTLRTVLNSRGITVEGVATTGRAPSDGEEVASFDSVPMSQVLTEMLKNSDNTTAELVLKEIGLQSKGQGTTAAGIEATKESLKNQSFDVTDLVMLDGSGLDTGNRMSCELSLALVSAVSQRPEFSDALPLGGKSGTLRKRMLATPSTGRVRAKTGTLNSVNALAGFADTPQGSTLSFAFMHNGTDPRTTGVADGFTDRLMAFPKGPKIALLEPLPVK